MKVLVWILAATSTLVYFGSSLMTSSSSYFERTYGTDTGGGTLKKEFYTCDRTDKCTNMVKVKGGKYETVNGEDELEKIKKDADCIWKKIKNIEKIPGS